MLSATAEHALRAMSRLAALAPGESALGRDLSRSARIPVNYLSKILLALRNAGLVEAVRGQGGGYRLAKPPEEVFLIDIVAVFEGQRARPGCFLGESKVCSDLAACPAHREWKAVRDAYLSFLTGRSLVDIGHGKTPPPRGKRRIGKRRAVAG